MTQEDLDLIALLLGATLITGCLINALISWIEEKTRRTKHGR